MVNGSTSRKDRREIDRETGVRKMTYLGPRHFVYVTRRGGAPRLSSTFNIIVISVRCIVTQPVHRWHFLTRKEQRAPRASIRDDVNSTRRSHVYLLNRAPTPRVNKGPFIAIIVERDRERDASRGSPRKFSSTLPRARIYGYATDCAARAEIIIFPVV